MSDITNAAQGSEAFDRINAEIDKLGGATAEKRSGGWLGRIIAKMAGRSKKKVVVDGEKVQKVLEKINDGIDKFKLQLSPEQLNTLKTNYQARLTTLYHTFQKAGKKYEPKKADEKVKETAESFFQKKSKFSPTSLRVKKSGFAGAFDGAQKLLDKLEGDQEVGQKRLAGTYGKEALDSKKSFLDTQFMEHKDKLNTFQKQLAKLYVAGRYLGEAERKKARKELTNPDQMKMIKEMRDVYKQDPEAFNQKAEVMGLPPKCGEALEWAAATAKFRKTLTTRKGKFKDLHALVKSNPKMIDQDAKFQAMEEKRIDLTQATEKIKGQIEQLDKQKQQLRDTIRASLSIVEKKRAELQEIVDAGTRRKTIGKPKAELAKMRKLEGQLRDLQRGLQDSMEWKSPPQLFRRGAIDALIKQPYFKMQFNKACKELAKMDFDNFTDQNGEDLLKSEEKSSLQQLKAHTNKFVELKNNFKPSKADQDALDQLSVLEPAYQKQTHLKIQQKFQQLLAKNTTKLAQTMKDAKAAENKPSSGRLQRWRSNITNGAKTLWTSTKNAAQRIASIFQKSASSNPPKIERTDTQDNVDAQSDDEQ